jgi:hypothetical protein
LTVADSKNPSISPAVALDEDVDSTGLDLCKSTF